MCTESTQSLLNVHRAFWLCLKSVFAFCMVEGIMPPANLHGESTPDFIVRMYIECTFEFIEATSCSDPSSFPWFWAQFISWTLNMSPIRFWKAPANQKDSWKLDYSSCCRLSIRSSWINSSTKNWKRREHWLSNTTFRLQKQWNCAEHWRDKKSHSLRSNLVSNMYIIAFLAF